MTTLHQAYVAADQVAHAAYERSSEETDETLFPQLQASYDEARERAEAAKKALIESDDPRPWDFAEDEGGRFLTVTLRPSEVEARLREEVARGNDDSGLTKTIWVTGYAHCDDTDESFTVEVTLEPDEPSCSEAEHDWQSPAFLGGLDENPGVFAHGGGVIINVCCMHCGCGKATDTRAQNPANGKQGLESVAYEVGKYVEQLECAEED